MASTTPGAVPRGCIACYRGHLGADPRQVQQQENRSFATARMGVNMAAPDVPAEVRDQLTEWVNVMAFSEALQQRLMKCKKGSMLVVMGNVTLKLYKTGSGEERVDRTVIAESLIAVEASVPDSAGNRVADAPDPHSPPTS